MDPLFFVKSSEHAARTEIRAKYIVLAEGQDDLYFLDETLKELDADPSVVQTMDYGGAGELPFFISSILKNDRVFYGDVKGLFVTGDADTFPAHKYKINKVLKLAGLPEFEHGQNTFQVPLVGRLGFHLLPDATDGNLETLLLRTVENVPAALGARKFVEDHHKDRSPKNDKRVATVYLATQPQLCRGSGQGARRGFFNMKHAAMDDLKAQLKMFITA